MTAAADRLTRHDLADQLRELRALVDQLATTAVASPATPKRAAELALDSIAGTAKQLDDELTRLADTLARLGAVDAQPLQRHAR